MTSRVEVLGTAKIMAWIGPKYSPTSAGRSAESLQLDEKMSDSPTATWTPPAGGAVTRRQLGRAGVGGIGRRRQGHRRDADRRNERRAIPVIQAVSSVVEGQTGHLGAGVEQLLRGEVVSGGDASVHAAPGGR